MKRYQSLASLALALTMMASLAGCSDGSEVLESMTEEEIQLYLALTGTADTSDEILNTFVDEQVILYISDVYVFDGVDDAVMDTSTIEGLDGSLEAALIADGSVAEGDTYCFVQTEQSRCFVVLDCTTGMYYGVGYMTSYWATTMVNLIESVELTEHTDTLGYMGTMIEASDFSAGTTFDVDRMNQALSYYFDKVAK